MFQLNWLFFQEWQLWDQRWYLIHLCSYSSCCGPFHMVADQEKLFLERHVSAKHSHKHPIDKHSEILYWKPAKMAKEEPLKTLSFLKSMRKLAEIFRINVFTTLEIHQKHATLSGMFILEKQMNLSRKSERCGILTGLILMLFYPTLWVALIMESLQLQWKPAAWQLPEGAERRCTSVKFHSQGNVIIWPVWLDLDDPTCMAFCVCTDSELAHLKCLFPGGTCQKHLGAII